MPTTTYFIPCNLWGDPCECCPVPVCCDTLLEGGIPETFTCTVTQAVMGFLGYGADCADCVGYSWDMTFDSGEGGWVGTIDLSGCADNAVALEILWTCDTDTDARATYYRAAGSGPGNWTAYGAGDGMNLGTWFCVEGEVVQTCDPLSGGFELPFTNSPTEPGYGNCPSAPNPLAGIVELRGVITA